MSHQYRETDRTTCLYQKGKGVQRTALKDSIKASKYQSVEDIKLQTFNVQSGFALTL